MKIWHKLVIIMLEMSLIPLFFLGFVTYSNIQKEFKTQAFQKLEALADIQKDRLETSNKNNIERLLLLTSRQQLRIETANYNRDENANAQKKINSILLDAVKVIPSFKEASVASIQGKIIASTNNELIGKNIKGQEYFSSGLKANQSTFFSKNSDEEAVLYLSGPLVIDDVKVGILVIKSDGSNISNITNNYMGLGESGETLLVKKDINGDVIFLAPTRFDTNAAFTRKVQKNRDDIPSVHAVKGEEILFEGVDYRGIEVYSVTRFIKELNWGMVIKIDKAEALSSTAKVKNLIIFVSFFTLLLVIVITISIAKSLINPIQSLTRNAEKVASGDLETEIIVETNDEIGILAGSFNTMTKNLRESYASLGNKIKAKTSELTKKVSELEDTKKSVLNILEDLSNEKANLEAAKAKDEAILASIGDGVAVADESGNLVYLNKNATEILGGEANNKSSDTWQEKYGVYDAENKNPLPPEEMPLSKALKGITVSKVPLFIRNAKFPEGMYITVTASPIFMNNKSIGGVAIFHDMTKELEIDKAKTEFVSLASHQLRTPLSAINWYTEMLLEEDAGKVNKEQKKYLGEIYTGSQRMVELVNALLNVSRLELGTFVIDPELIDISKLAESVVKEQMPAIKLRKQNIKSSFPKDLKPINADHKLLRMVFQNLLSNAVKYTPEKGDLEVSIFNGGKNDLVFSVKDSGYGIPKGQENRILSKLFRADNVREKDVEGTGLGLYIVKSIMDHSGGKVWFETKENVGTTFFASLPLEGMKKKEGEKVLT